MIALWTRYVAHADVVPFHEIGDLKKKAEKATDSTAGIVGKRIQNMVFRVGMDRNRLAVYAVAYLIAIPEDMEGLKEGRP